MDMDVSLIHLRLPAWFCMSVTGQMVSGYISSYDSGPLITRACPQVHEWRMKPLLSNWTRYWSSSSCSADDSQTYVSFNSVNHNNPDSLHCCPAVIKDRIASSLLQLITDKTAALVVGPLHISNTVTPRLGSLTTNTKGARDLGNVSCYHQHQLTH